VIASLWRTWYVAVVASPFGRRIVASARFLPWFLGLGGRQQVFSAGDAQIYARRLQQLPRARTSCLLNRSYLRAANDIFLHHRYHGDHLMVPTRLVFGDDDFYLPRSYIAGFEQHAPALDVEVVAGCGHFLPEELPGTRLCTITRFPRKLTGLSVRSAIRARPTNNHCPPSSDGHSRAAWKTELDERGSAAEEDVSAGGIPGLGTRAGGTCALQS
jgi:hypothetical protein